jgi:hypothetical protein
MKIKLNVDIYGFKKDSIIDLELDRSSKWRRLIRDSKIDNCVTILKKEKKKKRQEIKEVDKK